MDLPAVLERLSHKQLLSIHEAQSTPQIALWSGAVSSGKTISSLIAFLIAVADPPERGLIVIVGRTLQTIERNVIDPLQAHDLFADYAHVQHTTGSSVATILGRTVHLIGANDARSEGRIRGATIALAYVDEATLVPQAFWMMLLSRLRVPGARLMATTNPDGPGHWLRKNFMLRAGDVGMRYWNFRLDDNPSLTQDYVARLKKQYTGLWYSRFIDGAWCLAEGIIYGEWDESVHLVDPFPIPDTWTRWISCDFGYTNPQVIQWYAEDPDGRLWLYRELYRTQRTVDQHARDALATCTRLDPDYRHPDGAPRYAHHGRIWTEPKPRAIICDHDAEGRAVLERELGMSTVGARKAVSEGIQAVQMRLRPAGDGRPRLFVMRGALVGRDPELEDAKKPTSTEEEIVGYVWAVKPGGAVKEEPLKENDHGCLVAGTLVATPAGPVPIEEVQPGGAVLTRVGPRPVVASGMTSASAAVYRVELSTGAALTGTGDHPVWVCGKGWTRMDALRYSDRLLVCPTSSPYGSTGSSSAATPTPPTGLIASTTPQVSQTVSAAWDASMRRSGSRPTVPSLTVARSITPTMTPPTMGWTTSPASRSLSTKRLIESEAGPVGGLLSSWLTSIGFALSLPAGTVQRKGLLGTVSTRRSRGSAMPNGAPRHASTAAPPTRRPGPAVATGSAPISARPRGATSVASTTSSESAGTAAPSSPSTATPLSGAATARVLSVSAQQKRVPVYNLTVADQPEFFAQGVLVHNCDALRYVVAERDLGGRPRVRWLS